MRDAPSNPWPPCHTDEAVNKVWHRLRRTAGVAVHVDAILSEPRPSGSGFYSRANHERDRSGRRNPSLTVGALTRKTMSIMKHDTSASPNGVRVARYARLLAVAVVVSAFAGIAWGDQIVTDELNHPRARVVKYELGAITFRLPDSTTLSIPIHEVHLVIIDSMGGFSDFNQAENYRADGEPNKAILRYERARRKNKGQWAALVETRLVATYDEAERIDKAVASFIQIVHANAVGPAGAAELMPKRLPPKITGAVGRAIGALDGAIARATDVASTALFTLLRFDLYRAAGDRRLSAAADEVAGMIVPEAVRTTRAFAIQAAALDHVLSVDPSPSALANLDQAITDCPADVLGRLLLIKGHALLRRAQSRNDVIRASWPFMRVVIHMPNDDRVPEALLGAAEALDRIGRTDKADELLTECLAHAAADDAVRAAARKHLKSLRSSEDEAG